MADKTKQFPPDAIPKRYRDQIVPACAVGVPEPIVQASEQLRLAGLAAEAAVRRRRDADEAARVAPRVDQEAGIAAVKAGEDPPLPMAPERDREAVVAHQAEIAAKAIAREAELGLERTIRQHRDPWIAAQLERTETLAGDALAAVDELADALQVLGQSAGVVAALHRTPQGRGAIAHTHVQNQDDRVRRPRRREIEPRAEDAGRASGDDRQGFVMRGLHLCLGGVKGRRPARVRLSARPRRAARGYWSTGRFLPPVATKLTQSPWFLKTP